MADLVDVYKVLDGGILFHTKLEKLDYKEGKLSIAASTLAKRFVFLGDVVSVGYKELLLSVRVVGKSEKFILDVLYGGEGRLGDREKPRVPVWGENSFLALIKIGQVYRTFEPHNISETGLSVYCDELELINELIEKVVDFKFMGREELAGIQGKLRLVGIFEENPSRARLAFEMETEDVDTTRIRLYVAKAIKRLLES